MRSSRKQDEFHARNADDPRVLTEQLVGEARARRPLRMTQKERVVLAASAGCFLVASSLIALFVEPHRETDPLITVGLVVAYGLISRVRFEFGNGYVVPEQLMLVPLLLLAPLQLVPLLAAAGAVLAQGPELIRGTWHRGRWLGCLADAWFAVGPVLVLAALAPGPPELGLVDVYVLAFLAQIGGDLVWSVIRDRYIDGLSLRDTLETWASVARIDAALSPLAFLVTLPAQEEPAAVLAIGPLVWLLASFSRDRRERYAAALELHRAYRGTVMLLSDVVEFEDPYTAQHSRSIVELVHAVADVLGIEERARQELEFAALLHDVGKIAIPKEILNKPAALTDDEFELIKTHTIEGQFMLDRVGGLLGRVGEIVRSCHERWDGRGYPDGLAGEAIPLESRIVFVCDAYNAMTTDRVYRGAMSKEEALLELSANSGTQFDPDVVRALTKVVEQGEPTFAPVDDVRRVLANAQGLPSQLSASG
jgi:HD-GYP domain-containing protein (c-di-GMP phosphodiesterase class II)